jgi:hypothetical protein
MAILLTSLAGVAFMVGVARAIEHITHYSRYV